MKSAAGKPTRLDLAMNRGKQEVFARMYYYELDEREKYARQRGRRKSRCEFCSFLHETASEILAADWSSHYAAIKQHGEPPRLVRGVHLTRRQSSDPVGRFADWR